jgi:hypothetical protein
MKASNVARCCVYAEAGSKTHSLSHRRGRERPTEPENWRKSAILSRERERERVSERETEAET